MLDEVLEWDGTSWNKRSNGLCAPRAYHTTVVYGGEIYHMGQCEDNMWEDTICINRWEWGLICRTSKSTIVINYCRNRIHKRNILSIILSSIEKWTKENGSECDIYAVNDDDNPIWRSYIVPIFYNVIGWLVDKLFILYKIWMYMLVVPSRTRTGI